MTTPSEPSLLTPAVALATIPDPAVQPETTLGTIPDGEPVQSSNTGRRRTGKVACLPKTTRDLINRLLRDGRTYGQILTELGQATSALPYELSENNLSEWRHGGYQDWLAEQAWLEQTRARQESAHDLATDFDATQVNHAALQLGSLHILEALRDLKGANLDEKLGGSSAAFARLINALCRASKETLQLQKYREACAQARAQIEPLKDPHRKLTEEETRAIVHKIDQILGLAAPDDPPRRPPPSPVAPRPIVPAAPVGMCATASLL